MKTKTLLYMALTAVMTTLAACSQDDDMQQDATPKATPIEFEITDGGYGGDEVTRATEEGYYTKFEAGDACGLYIVEDDGNSLKAKNVRLTASEENGKLTWKADKDISGVTSNNNCFLYYPYKENETDVSSAADEDKDFFKKLISDWEVQPNQSNHDNYTVSDLMTAKGTATYDGSTLKLSFKLTHRMALAEIVAPVEVSFSLGGNCYTPYKAEDFKYRFIVNPGKMADGKYIYGGIGGKKFTIKSDKLNGLTAGQYKTFKVGSSYYVDRKEGESTDTYHVYDYNGLKAWADNGYGDNCKLEADIKMPELKDGETYNWTPVSYLSGIFDGNGHTITGLVVNSTGSYVGFIADNHGTVKNLTLKNANISGGNNTGVVVGENNGTISACHVAEDCSVIKGGDIIGGIAGRNNGGTVTGCYALCSLSGKDNYCTLGGIIGGCYGSGSFTACYSKCNYKSGGQWVGGIVGKFYSNNTSGGTLTCTACYYVNCAKGMNNNMGVNDTTIKVDGTEGKTWNDAMKGMNEALGADFGYQYKVNGDSQTEPLILVKKQ